MNFVTCINFANGFPFCIWCASRGDTQEQNLKLRVIFTPRGKLKLLECIDVAACSRRQEARADAQLSKTAVTA